MKPTPAQFAVLALIEGGQPVTASQRQLAEAQGTDYVPLTIASYQWSRDGLAVVAHRTVLTTETGNPRLDYRVEMFRIQRDGDVRKL